MYHLVKLRCLGHEQLSSRPLWKEVKLGFLRNPLKNLDCKRSNHHYHRSSSHTAGGWGHREPWGLQDFDAWAESRGESCGIVLASCGYPHCSFGIHWVFWEWTPLLVLQPANVPSLATVKWLRRSPQVGIRRALQGRAHNWGSICCNGLLFICLKHRKIAACGEPIW